MRAFLWVFGAQVGAFSVALSAAVGPGVRLDPIACVLVGTIAGAARAGTLSRTRPRAAIAAALATFAAAYASLAILWLAAARWGVPGPPSFAAAAPLVAGVAAAVSAVAAATSAAFVGWPARRGISLGVAGLGLALALSGAAWRLVPWGAARSGTPPPAEAAVVGRLLGERGEVRNAWQLAGLLAIAGDEAGARALDPGPGRAPAPRAVTAVAVPWERALEEIARERPLVLVNEHHNVSEHRELVRRALPIFARHGFRRYAAEALNEPAADLKKRGYPTRRTGYYTRDPRFGQLLRDALRLGFEPVMYEGGGPDIASREEHQASVLAEALRKAPGGRMLVHVGHAHLMKRADSRGNRWMAERLWEKTGVEPFAIVQLSSGATPDEDPFEYRVACAALGGAPREPVLVRSAPVVPAYADAAIVHPPIHGLGPGRRPAWLAAPDRRRVSGTLSGGPWPHLLVEAHDRREVEDEDAVPLDRVLVRQGGEAFELWVPREGRITYVVVGTEGRLGWRGSETSGRIDLTPFEGSPPGAR